MRLSEAIRLGSLTFGHLEKGSSGRCALNCGMAAVGKDSPWFCASIYWSWIDMYCAQAATINAIRSYKYAIAMLFDNYVVCGLLTLEALCDQVRAWEDELAAKGINVEQVTVAAEVTEPASPTQSVEKELEVVIGGA